MSTDKIAEIDMRDDITQKLRVTMPDFKGLEISCPCRIRSLLMKDAADEIEKLTRERDEARAALRWYADHRNHYPVLHHRRSGDPDPVAVFVEEPPIMTDGGRRAREALEAKP